MIIIHNRYSRKCKLRQQNCEVSSYNTSLVSSYLILGQILRQPPKPAVPEPRQFEVPANACMLLSDQSQGDPRVQLPTVSANTLYYVSR